MRNLIVLAVLWCGFIPALRAAQGCEQRLSREEFRDRQKAFIIEQAGLNKEEASKFFLLYYELQDQKKILNDESWEMIRKGKEEPLSEAQYEEIIERVCDNRIAAGRLDRSYLDKFKKILSSKKIYLVQRAEMRFHREMLRNVHGKGGKERRESKRR